MYGWQRLLSVGAVLVATLVAGNEALANGRAQNLGIGYGPGYNAACGCGTGSGFPCTSMGCCALPPQWTYHVWRGYECEKPAWWYSGRPRNGAYCP